MEKCLDYVRFFLEGPKKRYIDIKISIDVPLVHVWGNITNTVLKLLI